MGLGAKILENMPFLPGFWFVNFRCKKSRPLCGTWFKFEANKVKRLKLNIWAVIFSYGMSNGLNDRPELSSPSTAASHPRITPNNKSSWHPFSFTHFCLNGKCWGKRYHSFIASPKQSSSYNWWPKATQIQDSPFRADSLEQELLIIFNVHQLCWTRTEKQDLSLFYFIFFYFILFYFILFYFILFYFILLRCFFGAVCVDTWWWNTWM